MLNGGAGNDTLIGGAGNDTAAYSSTITAASVTSDGAGHFVVAAGASEGTDTLSGIEKIDGAGTANILLVGNGGYATIQAAIAAATAGDTIMIAAGTYNENLVVDKGVTLLGPARSPSMARSRATTALLPALTFRLADDRGVLQHRRRRRRHHRCQQRHAVEHQHRRLCQRRALRQRRQQHCADQCRCQQNLYRHREEHRRGYQRPDRDRRLVHRRLHRLRLRQGHRRRPGHNGLATNVTISGTHFEDMTAKGIYVEALSNALITGVSMDHVGFFGAGPASGGPGAAAGVGIEVNLKNGVYHDITITGFELTDTGTAPHDNSAAISVKTRDDAPSYNGTPATWTGGDLVISNGTIDTTSTGIRAGETNKNVAGPPVDINGVTITNALHDAQNGDVENVSQSVLTVEGTSGAETYAPAAVHRQHRLPRWRWCRHAHRRRRQRHLQVRRRRRR